MLKFRCDGTNIFLLLVDSSKFKREIFFSMRRNILYLREGRHIEHEVAPRMTCCCLYSDPYSQKQQAPKGGDRACFASMVTGSF